MPRPRPRLQGWSVTAAVLAALALVPLAASTYDLHLLTLTFVYGIMAMSLDLLVGYTGLSSLGHAAYFGVAGYTVGVLSTRFGLGFWPTAGLAVLAAVVTAALFGFLAIRATGAYFLIITLALGQIIWGLAYRWVSVTGGDNGLRGIPRPVLGWGIHLDQIHAFYYFALAVTAAAAGAMYLVTVSPFGSVVGSALLVFLQTLLSGITQRWLTVLGAILVLAVMYAPAGIVGAGQILLRRLLGPPRGRAVAAPTAGPNGVTGS